MILSVRTHDVSFLACSKWLVEIKTKPNLFRGLLLIRIPFYPDRFKFTFRQVDKFHLLVSPVNLQFNLKLGGAIGNVKIYNSLRATPASSDINNATFRKDSMP